MNELEWYIDYIEFQMKMKHKDNPMVKIDNDYILMQSIKVCLKHILDLKSSSGNDRGYRVQEIDSELVGLLFQKNRQTPIKAHNIPEIDNTSAI
jgi:hypothetical protein